LGQSTTASPPVDELEDVSPTVVLSLVVDDDDGSPEASLEEPEVLDEASAGGASSPQATNTIAAIPIVHAAFTTIRALPQAGRVDDMNKGVSGTGPIRSEALRLYEGPETPHRSCGIALAEAFGRPTAPYQSLRRGGITGRGTCGAVMAGQLLLGEFLGDPSPTGAVTPALVEASKTYQSRLDTELDRGSSPDLICNSMTAPHGDFKGPARHAFCTSVVAQVAQLVDETLREHGVSVEPTSSSDPV
jgi:hypothetical protein